MIFRTHGGERRGCPLSRLLCLVMMRRIRTGVRKHTEEDSIIKATIITLKVIIVEIVINSKVIMDEE